MSWKPLKANKDPPIIIIVKGPPLTLATAAPAAIASVEITAEDDAAAAI